jgi:hypothetical protein
MRKILAALLFASCAAAQSDRGGMTGRVTDPSGAAISGAEISLMSEATGVKYSTRSSETGNYLIGSLPFGRYSATVAMAGFRQVEQPGIDISVGQTVTLNFSLEVGQLQQTVLVSSTPSPVESASAATGTVVGRQQVLDLPLTISGNMRNPESFILLTPGVTGDTANTQINGSPSRTKEVLFDGAASTGPESGGTLATYPSVEAVGEFKLVSSTFNAEYGRSGSGFEVFTTRSGTNQLHGAAYDYFRNNALDARGFFAATTPINRQNEFGVNLGGPVVIPHVYDGHNRTFFYFVYGGFRYRAGQTNQLLSIPTTAYQQGDFSALTNSSGKLVPIYDPDTTRTVNGVVVRDQFPGNIIPQSRFSPVSAKITALYPTPTYASSLNNFLAVGASQFNRNQYDFKIDHNFTDNSRASVFVYINREASIDPLLLPQPFSSALDQQRPAVWIRANHDWIISPSTLNHFTAALTREPQIWHKLSADQDWPQKLGLTGINTGPGNAFPQITFTNGFSTLGDNSKTDGKQVNNSFEYTDTVTHTRGNHSIKVGADVRWLQTNGADYASSQGIFGFNSLETALASNSGNSGNALASFLLGNVHSASYRGLLVVPGNRYRYLAAFGQDDWKVNSRLTLNYGLRYEIYFPRTEAHNNFSGFDPTIANPGAGNTLGAVAFLGNGPGRNGRSSFADTDYRNFGPRFGFAFSIDPKTVLRGGYGLYYGLGNGNAGLRSSQNFIYGFNPSPSFTSLDSGATPAFNWTDGFPTNYPPPTINPAVQNGSSINAIIRTDGRAPYSQNWSFGLQRELLSSILVEADYVGVKGTRLGNNLIDFNQVNPAYLSLGSLLNSSITSPAAVAANIPTPYAGFKGTVAQALRPYPQYLSIPDIANPNGNSTYHALQAKVEKRMSHGLTFLAAYTFSKTISDSDIAAGGGPSGQTYYNRRLEKSVSTNDVPQIFVANLVYELPFGHGKKMLSDGPASYILGGWTVTAITQYQKGRPITLSATNTLPLFNSGLRPNVVAGVPLQTDTSNFDPAVDRWINNVAFQVPAASSFGTAARAYTNLRAPGLLNENFGLLKRMPLTERVSLTFRAEYFNVFNRVAFAAPDGNFSNASFGKISSQANTPRQGQLSLRLEF